LHRYKTFWYCWLIFFFFHYSEFHRLFPYYKRTLHIHLFIIMFLFCVYVCVLDLSPTYGLCLFKPGFLHLIWCLPIASICFHTTWFHFSLWLNKTSLYIDITFSYSIHQFYRMWVVSIAWLLWTVLQ
jgi:hypothetical protein